MQEPTATLVIKSAAEQRVEAEHGGESIEAILRRLYFDERLTQEQVAERLGVGASTVIRWFGKYGLSGRHPREFQAPTVPA